MFSLAPGIGTEHIAVVIAARRDIAIREVATPAEAVRFRYPDGAPPALAAAIVKGLTLTHADTVRRLLGRAPATFADRRSRNAGALG